MSQLIKCPHCNQTFDLSAELTKDIEKHLKHQLQNELQQRELKLAQEQEKFEEKRKQENILFKEKIEKEIKKREQEISKEKEAEHEAKFIALQKKLGQEQDKIKHLQRLEIDKLELENKIKQIDETHQLELRKQKLQIEEELKQKISAEILSKEREQFDLEKRKLEKQLDDQKKIAQDMQRKLEQGSMQTQGEIMELAIEEMLTQYFPYDSISEIKKFQHGADCILDIYNTQAKFCGRIVIESKNAENFSKDWIPKLKKDTQQVQGDLSILVSRKMPNNLTVFEQIDGVWVCRIHELISLVKNFREQIIYVDRLKQSHENRGEKKEMLYNFFVSNEFRQHLQAINEAYMALKQGVQEEKNKMERIWKAREKQIDKVLLTNNHLIGSIEGITGESINLELDEGDI